MITDEKPDACASADAPRLEEVSNDRLAIALVMLAGRIEEWGRDIAPGPGRNSLVDIVLEAAQRLYGRISL